MTEIQRWENEGGYIPLENDGKRISQYQLDLERAEGEGMVYKGE